MLGFLPLDFDQSSSDPPIMFRHALLLLLSPLVALISRLAVDDGDGEILVFRQKVRGGYLDLISFFPINPSKHVTDVVGRAETARRHLPQPKSVWAESRSSRHRERTRGSRPGREPGRKLGSQGSKARFRARFWSSEEARQEGRIGRTRRSGEPKRRVSKA